MPAKFTQVPRTCADCGREFLIHRCRLQRPRQSPALYCSPKCVGAARHQTLATRFWEKVDQSGTCWLWTGARTESGHGVLQVGRRPNGNALNNQAHRVSWELHRGPIPASLKVCHNCPGGDNPACVHPDHLFLDTQAGNVADAARKGRLRKGEGCHQAKLTEAAVREIRARYAAGGISQEKLAAEYGVGQNPISKIIHRKTWRHV